MPLSFCRADFCLKKRIHGYSHCQTSFVMLISTLSRPLSGLYGAIKLIERALNSQLSVWAVKSTVGKFCLVFISSLTVFFLSVRIFLKHLSRYHYHYWGLQWGLLILTTNHAIWSPFKLTWVVFNFATVSSVIIVCTQHLKLIKTDRAAT